ncbi:MAG: hypothetical protein L3J22_10275 [Xanthomonadales bacterium]|nr:hypothetical protein [Xanthomonadales bacterium]
MPFQTDEKLKSYLDTNQLHREQMCRAILAIDKRFSDVRPRHPRGGPDGGRDIEAVYRGDQTTYGAVGFVNQANDSDEKKKTIKSKFSSDLKSALGTGKKPSVFVFFTNINFTIGDKESLINKAKKYGIVHCEILDRERLRISLDSPDGFSIRFQYLNISLSEEEQASFFARWGDEIQSVISTGFQKLENTLNRLLFLQEANDPLNRLTFSFELKRKYTAEEIGHFRLFCSMCLKEPKHKILSVIFGSSDKSNRMSNKTDTDFTEQKPGIKYGICGGQWEQHIELEDEKLDQNDNDEEKYIRVGSSSSVGRDEIEFLSISYSKDSFIRFFPVLSLRDLDEVMFLPIVNKSLASKIKAIHIYSNGYKLKEISHSDLKTDKTEFEPNIPVEFSSNELKDPWVRIRPSHIASAFHIRFFEETPKRMFIPEQVENSLKK